MADLYYMMPSEIATYSATVATSAGATDTDYTDDWICDTRPGRPARSTGAVTWTVSHASSQLGMFVVCNCNGGNATIAGGPSATVTAGALGANGIRLNGFATITPANYTGFTIAFGAQATLGEIIAGKYRTLTRPVFTDDETTVTDFARTQEMDLSSIPPFDPGLVARTWSGSYKVNNTDKDNILEWYLGQRGGTRPSVVVPQPTVNDAMVGFLQPPSFRPLNKPEWWTVTLTFVEVPRVRWA